MLGSMFWVLVLASASRSGAFDHFASMLGSVARVSESAASVATLVLDSSADLATSTSQVVKAFSVESMDLVHTAWRGVDLLNLTCTKTAGRVVGLTASEVSAWFLGESGVAGTMCNKSQILDLWISAAHSVELGIPTVDSTMQHFNVSGEYWEAAVVAGLLPGGWISVDFAHTRVSFQARWANPFWELIELEVQQEAPQMVRQLQAFAQSVPAVNTSRMFVVEPLHPCTWLWMNLISCSWYRCLTACGEVGFMLAGVLFFRQCNLLSKIQETASFANVSAALQQFKTLLADRIDATGGAG